MTSLPHNLNNSEPCPCRLQLRAKKAERKKRVRSKPARRLAFFKSSANKYDPLVNLLTQTDSEGATPFHVACASGHHDLLTGLWEAGSSIFGQNAQGWTGLHYASWYGHVFVVQWLLDHKVDVKAKTSDGQTALDMARAFQFSHIVNILLEQGDE